MSARYHAAFSNGAHADRGSNRVYSHAWLVCWQRLGADGQMHDHSEQGFARSYTLAERAAHQVMRRVGRRILTAGGGELRPPGVVTFHQIVAVRAE